MCTPTTNTALGELVRTLLGALSAENDPLELLAGHCNSLVGGRERLKHLIQSKFCFTYVFCWLLVGLFGLFICFCIR